METDKTISISSREVEKQTDTSFMIENLPEDVVTMIFEYLDYDDICRAGRACKDWHQVKRNPCLNRRIVANISRHSWSISEATFKLLRVIPSYVTHIKLNFEYAPEEWYIRLDEFLKELLENCSNLQILILRRVTFFVREKYLEFCKQLPESLRVLAFHSSDFSVGDCIESAHELLSPKTEVLDFSRCTQAIIRPWDLSRLSHLKKLRLAGCIFADHFYDDPFEQPWGWLEEDYFRESIISKLEVLDLECTMISSATFNTLCEIGINLVELYLCVTLVKDEDLMFDEGEIVLPCLKTICLRNCDVTVNGIKSLMKACPSLVHIYVGSENIDAENPYAELKSEKVHVLNGFKHCDHYKNVNYFYE